MQLTRELKLAQNKKNRKLLTKSSQKRKGIQKKQLTLKLKLAPNKKIASC